MPVSVGVTSLPPAVEPGVLPQRVRGDWGLGLASFCCHQAPLSSLTCVLEEPRDGVGAPWASGKPQRWWPSTGGGRRRRDKRSAPLSRVEGGLLRRRWCGRSSLPAPIYTQRPCSRYYIKHFVYSTIAYLFILPIKF